MSGFDRFNLRPELRRALDDAGFDDPRPIQLDALPPALAGSDVLGLAPTGTGKTAAFVLPILQRLLEGRGQNRGKRPRALVVTPTRELAQQVEEETRRLARHTRLSSLVVFGGVSIGRHIKALRPNLDVLVACPGRLLDLLGRGAVDLGAVEVLVLDEADHMFDQGFLPDVRRILEAIPAQRQTLLFSATMPREIRRFADQVLDEPAVVELANANPAETIAHGVYEFPEARKLDALVNVASAPEFESAIVFLRTKHRVVRLVKKLARRGIQAVGLQGNMSQSQRDRAIRQFKRGKVRVLVATDIAARGLDIAGVSHVVNYDLPMNAEAYTHRIGRTGRSGASGIAITFADPNQHAAVRAIERSLGERIERLDPTDLVSGEAAAWADDVVVPAAPASDWARGVAGESSSDVASNRDPWLQARERTTSSTRNTRSRPKRQGQGAAARRKRSGSAWPSPRAAS